MNQLLFEFLALDGLSLVVHDKSVESFSCLAVCAYESLEIGCILCTGQLDTTRYNARGLT